MNSQCPPVRVSAHSAPRTLLLQFGVCPTHWMLRQFADRWSLPVLSALQASPMRFTELQTSLRPISHRMLGRTLKKLMQIGIVSRTVIPSTPPKVRYELTPIGRSIARPLGTLVRWAYVNKDAIETARSSHNAG